MPSGRRRSRVRRSFPGLQLARWRAIIPPRCRNLHRRSRRPLLTTIQSFIMMRFSASLMFCRLTVALFGSRGLFFRREEAEFPAALSRHGGTGRMLESTFRGRGVAGCASSTDALHPINNSVNLENQHEISFIRETCAAFARRIPTKGRTPAALSRGAPERSQENILAAVGSVLRQRPGRDQASLNRVPQRITPAAPSTPTSAAAASNA